MPQTSSPATHQEHLETLQSTVMDILQPKAANDLQRQRKGTAELRHKWTPHIPPGQSGADQRHLLIGPHPQGPQTG
ncbi:hypothetical protein M9458_034327, partial [Cirrhinus mrigala]